MDSIFQKLRSQLLLEIPLELKLIITQSKKQLQTDLTLLNLERMREQKRIREQLEKMQKEIVQLQERDKETSKKLEEYDEQLTQAEKTVTILQKNANQTKETLKDITKKLNKSIKENQVFLNNFRSVEDQVQSLKQKFQQSNCSLADLHSKTSNLSSLNKIDMSQLKNKMSKIEDFKWKKDFKDLTTQLKNIRKDLEKRIERVQQIMEKDRNSSKIRINGKVEEIEQKLGSDIAFLKGQINKQKQQLESSTKSILKRMQTQQKWLAQNTINYVQNIKQSIVLIDKESACYHDFDILANSVTLHSLNNNTQVLNLHYQLVGRISVTQKQFNTFTLKSDERDIILGIVHQKYKEDRSSVWSKRKQCIYYYVSTGAVGVGGKIVKSGKQSKKGEKIVMMVIGDKITWEVQGKIRNMHSSQMLISDKKSWVPFIAMRSSSTLTWE